MSPHYHGPTHRAQLARLHEMTDRYPADTFAGAFARRQLKELTEATTRPTVAELAPVVR